MDNLYKITALVEAEPPKMFRNASGIMIYDAIDTLRLSYLAIQEYLPLEIKFEDVERSLYWHTSISHRWKGSINDNF